MTGGGVGKSDTFSTKSVTRSVALMMTSFSGVTSSSAAEPFLPFFRFLVPAPVCVASIRVHPDEPTDEDITVQYDGDAGALCCGVIRL
jgi:hypothetical protein